MSSEIQTQATSLKDPKVCKHEHLVYEETEVVCSDCASVVEVLTESIEPLHPNPLKLKGMFHTYTNDEKAFLYVLRNKLAKFDVIEDSEDGDNVPISTT